jgi:hypothetical protein
MNYYRIRRLSTVHVKKMDFRFITSRQAFLHFELMGRYEDRVVDLNRDKKRRRETSLRNSEAIRLLIEKLCRTHSGPYTIYSYVI